MILIQSLFESVLKTNDSLEFAIITGCLRISKESIFTGLNNLGINSILTDNYTEFFGFTEAEVEKMLTDYGLEEKIPEVKKWYDGYLFGNTEVYNPWSVINYVYTAISNRNAFPKPYWSNTSSNSIVRGLVEKADEEAKAEIETLIQGGTIEKPVHEDITYEDIDKSQDNLWNFLFFTGYLKKTKEVLREETIYLTMKIPNMEVRYIFRNSIQDWFRQHLECISYNDYKEAYYHGFLCGLLKGCKGYRVISNRESGNGRYDIMMCYPSARGKAMIMEIKMAETFAGLEAGCDRALKQIEEQKYDAELLADGYLDIKKYGICFYKKECMVKKYLGETGC